jgi:hypothetical protein
MPRAESGRTESYIIQLRAEQLQKAGIPQPTASHARLPTAENLSRVLDYSFALEAIVREKLTERTSQRLVIAKDAAEIAKKAFENFYPSSVPAVVRSDPTYLAPGDDLKVAQETVVARALDRLKNAEAEQPLGKHSLRLNLTEEHMKELGLNIEQDGMVSGSVKANQLIDFLNDRSDGPDLYYRPRFEIQQGLSEVDQIIGQITATVDG